MELHIVRIKEAGEVEELATTSSERRALALAAAAARAGDGQIYIRWFRPSDGQRGYLNCVGGYAIVGKPW